MLLLLLMLILLLLLLLPLILLPLLPLLLPLPLPLPLLPYCCCCFFSRTPTKMDDDDFYYTTIPQRRLPRLLRLAREFHWPLNGCYVRYHRRPENASGSYLGAIFGFCGSLRVHGNLVRHNRRPANCTAAIGGRGPESSFCWVVPGDPIYVLTSFCVCYAPMAIGSGSGNLRRGLLLGLADRGIRHRSAFHASLFPFTAFLCCFMAFAAWHYW